MGIITIEEAKKSSIPIILSFGAGVDSTAIMVRLVKEDVDFISVFADTGGERPDIYAHIDRVNQWLMRNNRPIVNVVKYTKKGGVLETLYENSFSNNMLPSLAYGTKKCSLKYKQQPIAKFVRSLKLPGKKYISIIGYDISEKDRAEKAMESNKKSNGGVFKGFDIDFCFPLIDWKMGRDQCVEMSKAVGFCTAKSSCYYCPAMRRNEVLKLKREYPELFQKAIALEDNSKQTRKQENGFYVCPVVWRGFQGVRRLQCEGRSLVHED